MENIELDLGYVPSEYQSKIFNEVLHGDRNLFIEASAGSGKSSSIISIAQILAHMGLNPEEILFLAFNKHIVEHLSKKVAGKFTCKTINSLGHNIIQRNIDKNIILDPKKYATLLTEYFGKAIPDKKRYDIMRCLSGLLAKCMADVIDFSADSIMAVVRHYGIELPEEVKSPQQVEHAFQAVIQEGCDLALKRGIISYDDQLWIPALMRWKGDSYKYVLVDEAQDLSKGKLQLAMSAMSENSRFIAVADRNQSIFGFAAADANSVNNIIAKTDALTLPLSISYRCPKKVIELAQKIVPTIECAPNAIEGNIYNIYEDEFLNTVKPSSMVLCRKNAPLLSLCIKLIKNRIGAIVLGREIGSQLKTTMKEIVGKNGMQFLNFKQKSAEYSAKKIMKLMEIEDNESLIEGFRDKMDCLHVIYDGYMPSTLKEFEQHVDDLFADESNLITLSSVHKAKGLECEDVYIYMPELLPLRWKNQRPWEREQEMNLKYVALTRSKNNLTFVRKRKEEEEDAGI